MVEGAWVDRNAIRIRLRLLVAALQRSRLRQKSAPPPGGYVGTGQVPPKQRSDRANKEPPEASDPG